MLGIDPGNAVTGFGIVIQRPSGLSVLDYGCIRPPRNLSSSQRRQIIFDALCHLMETHQPEAVVVETQFVQKNIQSAITLGMVRGITLLAATQRNIPTFEYAPAKAKRAVTGRGRASKHQVREMVRHLLTLAASPPEDAADALALAICHLNAVNFSVALGKEI